MSTQKTKATKIIKETTHTTHNMTSQRWFLKKWLTRIKCVVAALQSFEPFKKLQTQIFWRKTANNNKKQITMTNIIMAILATVETTTMRNNNSHNNCNNNIKQTFTTTTTTTTTENNNTYQLWHEGNNPSSSPSAPFVPHHPCFSHPHTHFSPQPLDLSRSSFSYFVVPTWFGVHGCFLCLHVVQCHSSTMYVLSLLTPSSTPATLLILLTLSVTCHYAA